MGSSGPTLGALASLDGSGLEDEMAFLDGSDFVWALGTGEGAFTEVTCTWLPGDALKTEDSGFM